MRTFIIIVGIVVLITFYFFYRGYKAGYSEAVKKCPTLLVPDKLTP